MTKKKVKVKFYLVKTRRVRIRVCFQWSDPDQIFPQRSDPDPGKGHPVLQPWNKLFFTLQILRGIWKEVGYHRFSSLENVIFNYHSVNFAMQLLTNQIQQQKTGSGSNKKNGSNKKPDPRLKKPVPFLKTGFIPVENQIHKISKFTVMLFFWYIQVSYSAVQYWFKEHFTKYDEG